MSFLTNMHQSLWQYFSAIYMRFTKLLSRLFNDPEFRQKLKRFATITGATLSISALLILFFYLFVFAVKPIQEMFVRKVHLIENQEENPNLKKELTRLEKEHQTLLHRYNALTPKQNYLVINTTDNHFFLYRDKLLIREGFVSSGSNIRLQAHDEREWLFRTPRGKHTVKGKITRPVWRKPDWAFIEDGLPVPSGNHPSRYEAGVLGDYALNLGNGYLVHGTLYKRFLGMPVTHGCIRLNDEDLEFIFKALNVGSRVYIY